MVGLVLISHSHALAEASLTLVRAMAGEEVPIAVAAGAGENHEDLGTDAMEIFEAITSVANNSDGVVVMMDMGSAILSAEMALDFLDEDTRAKVRLCPSSFIEGAVAASVAAKIGGSMDDVLREAAASLSQKTEHIEPLPKVTLEPVAETAESGKNSLSQKVKLPMHNGLHARPVSKLVQEAAKYKSTVKIRDLTNGKGPVSIKSITGIIALEALFGHEVELIADGEDAAVALEALCLSIENGLGDPLEGIYPQTAPSEAKSKQSDKPIGVCKGIVIAPIHYSGLATLKLPEDLTTNIAGEIESLHAALFVTVDVLKKKAEEVCVSIGKEQGDIFLAQAAMLDDPALVDRAEELIRTNKMQAATAWWLSVQETVEGYKRLADDNLRQRALDLQDVARVALKQLGIAEAAQPDMHSASILVAEDLTPGQAAELDKEKILGVICLENGQTSHSSILLRSRAIPAIVQAQRNAVSLRDLSASTLLAMDGETGEIWIDPRGEQLKEIQKRQAEWKQQAETEKKESAEQAVTADGKRIEIFANVGNCKEDSLLALENGAEGIGLLRTEFLFLHRDNAPSEEEQVAALHEILAPMKGKPIIIRTLDAGGDKELPYLNMPKEANPFLGVRAIRLTLRNHDLFQQQLRAILRVSVEHNLRIMFPMISKLSELHAAKSALNEAHESLAAEGVAHTWPITTGMMMEVPSSAIMAHLFAPEVDFVSIGTNDLVQYTMAADRGNPELQQSTADGFDPSVVAIIAHIAQVCKKQGIPVGVCGESAADPELASLLIGLGVTELSMNAGSIPEIKYKIRSFSYADLEKKGKQQLL